MRALDLASSLLASAVRAGAGLQVEGALGPRPERPLELYEFESCPFCRKVREAMTALDLDPLIYPCPKGGARFRPEVIRRGGKAQFPYLVDPNGAVEMYESNDIVAYLFATYGATRSAWYRPNPLLDLAGSVASALRAGAGVRSRRSRAPAEPLELWSFEASPYCRLVRETVCELELPYRLHNLGRGSPKRPAFRERVSERPRRRAGSGKLQVPYLEDRTRGAGLFESADIQRYLLTNYSL